MTFLISSGFYLKKSKFQKNNKKNNNCVHVCGMCNFQLISNYFSLVKFFSSFVVQKQKSWKNHGETFDKKLSFFFNFLGLPTIIIFSYFLK